MASSPIWTGALRATPLIDRPGKRGIDAESGTLKRSVESAVSPVEIATQKLPREPRYVQ